MRSGNAGKTRIIVTSTKDYNDFYKVFSVLEKLLQDKSRKETEIIPRHCRCAEFYAYYHGWKLIEDFVIDEEMIKYAAEAEQSILITFSENSDGNIINLAKQYGFLIKKGY